MLGSPPGGTMIGGETFLGDGPAGSDRQPVPRSGRRRGFAGCARRSAHSADRRFERGRHPLRGGRGTQVHGRGRDRHYHRPGLSATLAAEQAKIAADPPHGRSAAGSACVERLPPPGHRWDSRAPCT